MPDPFPSTDSRAVFVSYASQDADAVRRICESLRAHGVEVWFDQNELAGGEQWDRKIRGQIGACALFVPVISANTQARSEGYFRLEWKLAEDRSHLMAKGRPFIVPVSVDGTTERGALVPDAFMAVQWTRLPGGETSQAFITHVKRLLGLGETPASEAGHLRPAPSGEAVASSGKPARSVPGWLSAAMVAVILGLAGYLGLRPGAREPAVPASVATEKKPSVAAAPTPIALPASDKSIAVLPFTNMSEEKDSAFFADGMHEDILTNLARIRELRVVSRTSVMEYRGTTKKIPQIARELNVAYVLEGSVRRAGKKVRVTGQLIRAGTDEHVWAQNYDRDLTDVFSIQAQLAQAIAGELRAALSPREQEMLARRPTENPAAYDLYLKSRQMVSDSRSTRANLQMRVSLLESGVELDAKFAAAWGELAEAHVGLMAASVDTTPARLAKAKVAIDRALALAPDAPGVMRSLSVYHAFGLRDNSRATELAEKLVQLLPNDAESRNWLGVLQFLEGRWPEAIATRRLVSQLDPGNWSYTSALVDILMRVRRYDEAITEMRRILALWPDRDQEASRLALLSFRATGSRQESHETLARLEARDPNSLVVFEMRKRRALAQGDYAEFFRLDRLQPASANLGSLDSNVAGALMAAFVHVIQGNRDGARARLGTLPATLRAQLELEPDNTQVLRSLASLEGLILGRRDEALRYIERAAELVPEAKNAFIGVSVSEIRAHIHAWTGDKDRAIAEYARLLRIPSGLNVHEMRSDLRYTPLRGDPRFEALLNDPKNNAPLY